MRREEVTIIDEVVQKVVWVQNLQKHVLRFLHAWGDHSHDFFKLNFVGGDHSYKGVPFSRNPGFPILW